MKYELYADGACQPNPGTGGWGFLIRQEESTFEVTGSGSELDSTNNRMELTGLLKALEHIESMENVSFVQIILDSKYVLNGLELWSKNWIRQGWVKKDGKPVLNADLWKQLIALTTSLTSRMQVGFKHVKGHSGHKWNDRCDELAVAAIKQLEQKHEREREKENVA